MVQLRVKPTAEDGEGCSMTTHSVLSLLLSALCSAFAAWVKLCEEWRGPGCGNRTGQQCCLCPKVEKLVPRYRPVVLAIALKGWFRSTRSFFFFVEQNHKCKQPGDEQRDRRRSRLTQPASMCS